MRRYRIHYNSDFRDPSWVVQRFYFAKKVGAFIKVLHLLSWVTLFEFDIEEHGDKAYNLARREYRRLTGKV